MGGGVVVVKKQGRGPVKGVHLHLPVYLYILPVYYCSPFLPRRHPPVLLVHHAALRFSRSEAHVT